MFKKLTHDESGFTLVELLVTIAILAVLFGIVTLTLSGLSTDAAAATALAECGVVQSAADIWLAADVTNSITARVVGDVDVIDTGDAEFAVYLRHLPTEYEYYWDANGNVTCAAVP
jgi:prepilin-type N-terminal cleavage/methylation domain-containing protein